MGKLVGAVWCWWYRQIAGNSILHKNQTGCDKIKPGKGVQHFFFFFGIQIVRPKTEGEKLKEADD